VPLFDIAFIGVLWALGAGFYLSLPFGGEEE
jgi:hypothetical protein